MEFKLLGPLEASDGSTPIVLTGRKQRALLARLLLDVNRTVATERLEELHVACLEARIDADLDRGRHVELAAELEVPVARYPLREGFRAQQLLALYRSGRQSEALTAYQAFRAYLADTVGLEPSARLKELERRILRHDPDLDLQTAPPALPVTAAPEVQ